MDQVVEKYLNYDSATLIMKNLNLKEQLAAAQAFRCFHVLLTLMWQKKYTYLDSNQQCLREDNENLSCLMSSICSTLQKLKLDLLTTAQFKVLKKYKFPALRVLILYHPKPCWDKSVLEMTELFPNIHTFEPNNASMSGRHMEKWRHLEHLYLDSCTHFQLVHFERILEAYPLKSVKLFSDAFITDDTWTSKLAIEKFKKLKKISLHLVEHPWLEDLSIIFSVQRIDLVSTGPDEVFEKFFLYMCEHKNDDLIEMKMSTVTAFDNFFKFTFKNLQRFFLFCGLSFENFAGIIKSAPNLKEIIIVNCDSPLKQSDILHFLYSDKVTYISVEECECGFEDLELDVEDVFKRRTSAVVLNFYENKYWHPELGDFVWVGVNVQGETSLLRVTEDIRSLDAIYRFQFH